MIWTILFTVYISGMNYVVIFAQNPIGLRVSVYLRDLLLETAPGVSNLRRNVDDGNYTSNTKKRTIS